MIIVEIAGRLGADPEVRYTPNNQKVTTMRVATNVYKGGKEETVWWRVTVWGDRFDKMMNYLKKGSAVVVIGDMHKPEIWTNRDGNSQISMEMTAEIIKFSPFGKSDQASSDSSIESDGFQQGKGNSQSTFNDATMLSGAANSPEESTDDDGLPF